MSPRSAARLQIIGAALLFSTGGAAIKATAFSGWQVASFRSGIAALAVLAVSPAARRGWTWPVALIGVTYAATLVLFVIANKLTTSANTIFLQSTAPIYLLVLSPVLLHEPVRREDLKFMAAVGLGLLLFFVSAEEPVATAPDPLRGNFLAALSGVSWAVTVAGLRWLSADDGGRRMPDGGRGRGSPVAAVVSGNITAFLVCLPFVLPVAPQPVKDWILVVYLGVFQIALAYIFVTAALRTLPAFEAALLLLIEPALNPIWSWIVHGEVPAGWAIAGGALILGATTLKTWAGERPVAPAA